MEIKKGYHFYTDDGGEIEVLEDLRGDRTKVAVFYDCHCFGNKQDRENCDNNCDLCQKCGAVAFLENMLKCEFSKKNLACDYAGRVIIEEWFSEDPKELEKIFGKPMQIIKR